MTRDQAGLLVRIDRRTGREKRLRVGASPFDVLLAKGSVWVSSYGTSTIARIDADTGRLRRVFKDGPYAAGLAFCGGRVWVGHGRDPTWLTAIDPATHRMSKVDMFVAGPAWPRCVRGELWVTTPDSVLRIDPRTGALVARVRLGGTPAEAAAGPDGMVWVTDKERSLVFRIDPATNDAVGSFAAGPGAYAMTRLGSSMWITSFAGSAFRALTERLPDKSPRDGENARVDVPRTEQPIRLVVRDGDLARQRLTVFFRLILAIPVFIWLLLWGIATFFVAIVLWFAVLIRGTAPEGLHDFVAGYLRYWAHVSAYLLLAADPYPWFQAAREYPIDLDIEPPARQSRWKAGFRFFLALPALLLAATLGGTPGEGGWQAGSRNASAHGGEWRVWGGIGGVAAVCAFLTWFVALVRGRAPRGLRDLTAYSLGYTAQATGYFLLLTDRFPTSEPALAEPYAELPPHPVRIAVQDPLERSRLTVFFRLLLAIPHFIWLILWTVAIVFAVFLAWVVALVTGRVPDALHRFIAAYVRYAMHVSAFVTLVGGRFPGFVGRQGSYGIDVQIDAPHRQSRWVTLFRLFLAIPAIAVSGALSGALFVLAFLGWWYALVTGRMPEGLRNLGAACLRYAAQVDAYLFLLTSRYPYGSPVLEERREPEPSAEIPEPGVSA